MEESRRQHSWGERESGRRKSDVRRLIALPSRQRRALRGRVRHLKGCIRRVVRTRGQRLGSKVPRVRTAGSPVEMERPITTPSWSELLKMPPATPANSLGIDIMRAMLPLYDGGGGQPQARSPFKRGEATHVIKVSAVPAEPMMLAGNCSADREVSPQTTEEGRRRRTEGRTIRRQ
jgi:hypothetical protein